ncbi:hypothetical protein G4B88_023600 [Cannabis sativa]|uniref:Uncharacterized protein n=1 Tax=Cannabis sativa TaxID=3483 RepID=A0A7J6HUX7_CANSA|nr:hypothetical protein G4B88_023600 [Cannabis sativa]
MGALGLYEASFHGKKGEMNHALEMPQLQWRILDKKLNGLLIEEIYERKQDMNPTLLEFAKLDFNMELLVAVSFGLAAFEAVANRRSSSQMRRFACFSLPVTDEWWCEPGHGDWCTCLEKYTLSRDDQFGRLLPTFLQVIDLTDDEESDYWVVVSDVFDGKQLDYYTSRPSLNAVTWSSMETSINNKLIDTLQRLGISYHFKNEINTILKKKYTDNYINNNIIITNPNYNNLYAIALEFRLLRQHGYTVPQEIFNAFKDKRGKFKTCLSDDIMGVLCLYEASFYAMKHENILEEARIFSTKCLKKYMEKMENEEEKKILLLDDNNINSNLLLINHAFELPLHWRITRSEARWFIDEIYEKKQDMNSTLFEFAKLDFNIVQSTHQEDLQHLSRWWRDCKLGGKLNFARDRLMEAFLWDVGLKFEGEFSYFRRINARLFVLITIIDDIYDVYGTLEELELFTSAVERWDVKLINELPDYMKMPFFVLHNTINEMGFDVLVQQNFVNIEYLKKSDELNRGDVPKSIQCYMYDNNATEDEAREHIKFLISETWKDMNKKDEDESCLSENFVEVCKNMARTALFIYENGDGHGSQNSLSKERISTLIITPINIPK